MKLVAISSALEITSTRNSAMGYASNTFAILPSAF